MRDNQVKMFQREAETLARLKHPNIGAIYESGRTEDGHHFFAMELVRGETLDRYFARRPESIAIDDLAIVLQKLGRPDEAEELLLEGLEASARDNGEADVSTTTTRAYLAKFYAKYDRMDEARAVISDQLSALRAAAEASSEPGPKNAYAWEALTCESADLQDPEDALVFALEAVELGQWQDLDVMDTLALAYHRTGNNAKAVEVEMKALDLIPEVDTARREPFESALAEYRSAIED